MRSYLPSYDLRAAASLEEALRLLAESPGGWRPFAGGTDLMVLFEAGALSHRRFLSIWGLRELRGIEVTGEAITLGALTTYTDVLRHEVLRREFPLLCRAAAETGGVATQNRGTLGGNIANASPAADTPPALLVYDASLELISVRGVRVVAYDRFHTGYKQMDLAPDELIRAVRLPRGRAGWMQSYRKVGTRRAQAISKLCFAGALDVVGGRVRDARLAFASVAATVVRARQAEAVVQGQVPGSELARRAVDALASDIAPIDDLRSSARYRLRVAQNLLGGFVAG
ncbi:MAG TPA: xanthine dehydrogenase family protein subunit M [Vicinamibacterales bacterium]|nr:xanthine dehydrogenase family protein subunit M [Vicinamibacterales bacterium]